MTSEELQAMGRKRYITAKTFPLSDLGEFQSEPAEAAYRQFQELGGLLSRDAFRLVIQAYQCKQDECERRYNEFRQRRERESGVSID
jgi:hypothetical protein